MLTRTKWAQGPVKTETLTCPPQGANGIAGDIQKTTGIIQGLKQKFCYKENPGIDTSNNKSVIDLNVGIMALISYRLYM